jgi:hypothetical protein
MTRNVRRRFWPEVLFTITGFGALTLALGSRNWIEQLVGIDPDRGSGTLEWAIAFCFALLIAILIHPEYRRSATTPD